MIKYLSQKLKAICLFLIINCLILQIWMLRSPKNESTSAAQCSNVKIAAFQQSSQHTNFIFLLQSANKIQLCFLYYYIQQQQAGNYFLWANQSNLTSVEQFILKNQQQSITILNYFNISFNEPLLQSSSLIIMESSITSKEQFKGWTASNDVIIFTVNEELQELIEIGTAFGVKRGGNGEQEVEISGNCEKPYYEFVARNKNRFVSYSGDRQGLLWSEQHGELSQVAIQESAMSDFRILLVSQHFSKLIIHILETEDLPNLRECFQVLALTPSPHPNSPHPNSPHPNSPHPNPNQIITNSALIAKQFTTNQIINDLNFKISLLHEENIRVNNYRNAVLIIGAEELRTRSQQFQAIICKNNVTVWVPTFKRTELKPILDLKVKVLAIDMEGKLSEVGVGNDVNFIILKCGDATATTPTLFTHQENPIVNYINSYKFIYSNPQYRNQKWGFNATQNFNQIVMSSSSCGSDTEINKEHEQILAHLPPPKKPILFCMGNLELFRFIGKSAMKSNTIIYQCKTETGIAGRRQLERISILNDFSAIYNSQGDYKKTQQFDFVFAQDKAAAEELNQDVHTAAWIYIHSNQQSKDECSKMIGGKWCIVIPNHNSD